MTAAAMTFSDLPETIRRPLTIGEVAAIADVDRKVVNRMVDDGVLPRSVLVSRRARGDARARRFVKASGIPMVLLVATTGGFISKELRKTAFAVIERMIRENITTGVVEAGALTLDLSTVMSDALARMIALARAEEDVESDPDVRGGAPVMRGTRILAHELASLAEIDSVEAILEGYPGLTQDRIKNATIYAKAHPLNGRPRKRSALPQGARIVSASKIDLGAL